MSLATLPGELYTVIIQHLDSSSWTQAVLALSRALPSAPIPIQLLFHSVRIRHPRQAISLHSRLHKTLDVLRGTDESPDPCASWVKEFSVECWTVDADMIISIIRLLPNLCSLNVRIGPSNFSPEHLEQLFEKPIGALARLSLRFKPYVKKASYHQFHQGAYFDSTLMRLARWPPQRIPTVSIVQDPQDARRNTSKKSFAQPIVFFLLDPQLSVLVHSPSIAHSMTSLRLRLPSRSVARPLCMPPPAHAQAYYSPKATPVVPSLEFLDLSTCGVIEGEIDMILSRFRRLKHLVIDKCAVLRAELHQGEWSALGKCCALAGVKRARDREKELKAWAEERFFGNQQTLGSDDGPAQLIMNHNMLEPPRQKPGRRGLAAATISIRDRVSGDPSALPTHTRGPNIPSPALTRTRILPFVPNLKTLATTTVLSDEPSRHLTIRAEFEAGWAEGIAQLAVARARMRTSSRNGVRLLKFIEDAEHQKEWPNGMQGLEDVDPDDENTFKVSNDTAPILCLAGPSRNEHHIAGCGHSIGWNLWQETEEEDNTSDEQQY